MVKKTNLSYDLADGEYQVGIRPEGFRVVKDGGFDIKVDFISTIGRDVLIRFYLNNEYSKALVEAENNIKAGDVIKLELRENCVHIFDQDGKRIAL